MPLSLLLLVSLAILAAEALLLLRAPGLRRALLRRSVLLRGAALAVLLSLASAMVRTSGASGTGTRTLFGFPKPFFFTWESWEHPASSSAGMSSLYFAGNCAGWFALLSLAALGWTAIRRRRSGHDRRRPPPSQSGRLAH